MEKGANDLPDSDGLPKSLPDIFVLIELSPGAICVVGAKGHPNVSPRILSAAQRSQDAEICFITLTD